MYVLVLEEFAVPRDVLVLEEFAVRRYVLVLEALAVLKYVLVLETSAVLRVLAGKSREWLGSRARLGCKILDSMTLKELGMGKDVGEEGLG